jgi:long-chain acyl-CoA synthetase
MAYPGSRENIFEAFASVARENRNRTAVVYLGTRYSYGRLLEMAESASEGLRRHGLREGMRAIIYLPNSIQWIASWLGIIAAGATAVPITPIYTSHDFRYIASDSDADFAICSDTNFGYVLEAMPGLSLRKVFVARMADLLPWWKRAAGWAFDVVPRGKISKGEKVVRLREIMGRTGAPSIHLTGGGDAAEILYTGGTTKFPKGVPISHGLFLQSSLEQITNSDHLFPSSENIIIGSAPLFHILGQTCGLSVLLVGGTIALMPKVNLDAIFDAVQRLKATSLIGVPTLYRMILEHNRLDLYDLSSLKYCFNGGDVLPVEINQRWGQRFNRPIYQGYGATETCGGVSMCPTDRESPLRSIGKVVPSKTVMIVDPETLEPVKKNQPGELLVHSERMVRGYWNKPEETEAAFVSIGGKLWYRTADIVSMDDEGYLYFIDRTVDTIKHKGYRISSSEIEAVLQEHPAVTGACAIGVPDPKVGERIKAFVVLKEDVKGITGYELIKWCRERLASYKVPQYIEFRDMLPKSKVGKLLRREVRGEEKRRTQV